MCDRVCGWNGNARLMLPMNDRAAASVPWRFWASGCTSHAHLMLLSHLLASRPPMALGACILLLFSFPVRGNLPVLFLW